MDISVANLLTLQSYSLNRRQHRQRLMRHRRERSLALGPCMHLQFEDELTIRYQIQEVLHAERAASAEHMQHEIDTYAHLVPDGTQWMATLLIGLPDAAERHRELPQLNEAAHRLYVEMPRQPRVYALANEDLADRHLSRPSAVHFLRFQFDEPVRAALLAGCTTTLGCDHPRYEFRRVIPPATIERLRRDLTVRTHGPEPDAEPAMAADAQPSPTGTGADAGIRPRRRRMLAASPQQPQGALDVRT